MPRNVRNFWLEASIDGRDSRLSGGPQARTGGMSGTIYQRDRGDVAVAVRWSGHANEDGRVVLIIEPGDGMIVEPVGNGFRIVTARD